MTQLDQNLPLVSDSELQSTINDISTPVVLQIFEMFTAQVEGDLPKLKTAIEVKDQELSVRLAHSIKGSSRYLAASQMAAIFEIIETACAQSDWTSAAAEVPTANDVWNSTKPTLTNHPLLN